MASSITLTADANVVSGVPGAIGVYGSNGGLDEAIQTIWSKEILFQAMPILRYEQFAVKKTELGVQPGLQIKFMRYRNLSTAGSDLTEGVRMETDNLLADAFNITVAEKGKAVAVSELLLNASFDDVMASASRLLGRQMAMVMDEGARDTLLTGSTVHYGYQPPHLAATPPARTTQSPYDPGTISANRAGLTGTFYFGVSNVKDAVERLATQNIPRLGETYVCFIHPSQSRRLRDNPEWIEVTKYAGPGNFMLGEIGRINDVVFIETTQVKKITNAGGGSVTAYQASMIGDNAFGHAISLPVELRDGGVLDYGREHGLAWYSIWGYGRITDEAIVTIETN